MLLVHLRGDVGHAANQASGSGVSPRRLRWVLDLPRGIQVAAGMALLIGGFGYQFEVTNPLMATKVFQLGAVGFGLMGTFMAVGGIAGSYYSSRRADPGRSEFLVWAAVFGGAEMLAAVMPAVWAYDVLMIALGAATALFATSATVYIQQAAPQAQRGHALSAYNAGFMGFVPAGAFAVAGIAAVAGTRWALLGLGLVMVICSAAALAAGARVLTSRSCAPAPHTAAPPPIPRRSASPPSRA